VRGATSVEENTAEAILDATRELLLALVDANGIEPEDVASIHFTTTPRPGTPSARRRRAAVGLERDGDILRARDGCVARSPEMPSVLILWNTACAGRDIQHVHCVTR
jgi:chorismate mutase